jgi:predicted RNA-binding Zn-ribbon protein involved in translation (DUF1610 family)
MNKSILQRARAFYKVNPTFDVCPSCKGTSTIMRSHTRNLKEKIISKFFFYKYYRCKKCGWRGLLKTIAFTGSSLLVMILYLLLVFAAGFITYQILKRLL